MGIFRSGSLAPRPDLQSIHKTFWHCLQLYDHADFLAETVAQFTVEGLSAGEAVILIARDRNRTLFEERIASDGLDPEVARGSGQLVILSAEEVLAHVTAEGWPGREVFNLNLGGEIRTAAAKWVRVRVFSELMAVLWDAGHPAMALRLEQLWEDLAETENFSLLCGHPLNAFQGASQSAGFCGVCDSHTLILPTESYLKLDQESDRLKAVARLQQAAAVAGNRPVEGSEPEGQSQQLTNVLKQIWQARKGAGLIGLVVISPDNGSDGAQEAWKRIQGAFTRAGEHVIQTEPSEFALVATDLPDFASAHKLVQQLRQTLDRSSGTGPDAAISACVGIEIASPHNTDPLTLRRNAELALRRARQKGRGRTEFYSARLGETARLHQQIESRLKEAVDRNELQIFFQPEISLRNLRPTRFEALLRWFPSHDCSVPPSTFIPVAEECGLIPEIGEWVLRQSCRQAVEWQKSSLAGAGVAVNVSALQFSEPGFVELVEDCLRESGLRPGLLELELTETVLIRDFEQSNRTLKALKQLGVTVAIDDFGTGYSSLGYLQKLSVDALKIDRCFIAGLEDFHARAPVLRGVVGIARELGIRVIAEGIETPEQYHAVAQLGCDEVQGFLMGRPTASARDWRSGRIDEQAA